MEYSSGEYRFHTTEYAQTKSCIKRDNILLLNSMYDSRCASCLGLFTVNARRLSGQMNESQDLVIVILSETLICVKETV